MAVSEGVHFLQIIREAVHPARPGWYEELYAAVMNTTMRSYEAEVSFQATFESGA